MLDSNTLEYGVGIIREVGGNRARLASGGRCVITGLEVIRGRGNTTRISHSGFSTVSSSEDISINVSTDNYSIIANMDLNSR